MFAISAQAVPISFTGSYSQNFDGVGPAGTSLPAGFASMDIPGSTGTYTAAKPVNAAGMAAATNNTQTLTIWNAGSAVVSSGTHLYNVGCWDGASDRALGSDAASTGAQVIELSLVNNTGSTLYGITVSYDCKCLTNGVIQSGGTINTEETELPGYCFFYSTTGTNSAADWTEVGVAGNAALVNGVPAQNGLCLPNFTQGTTMSSGAVNITFATPLTNNGVMFLRWADDNNIGDNPEQMLAIDNVSVSTYNPLALQVSITSPTPNSTLPLGTNVVITASASESGAAITNVEFYANATDLGGATGSPYMFTWQNAAAGNYALTAVASDDQGQSVTSSVVNVTVAYIPPAVNLTGPPANAYFLSPATVSISASAASSAGTVTNVSFYEGTTLLGNATNAPYVFDWTNVAAGAYSLSAQVADDKGFSATSDAITVRVVEPPIVLNPLKFSSSLKVTFSGYTQGEALTNFPVLVRLSTNLPGFSYDQFTSAIGADLQFAASTNLQALPYEIEQWNPAGESLIWVQVPLITGPDDYITAYWGNPALTKAAASNTNGLVWKDSFLMPGFTGAPPVAPATNTVRIAQISDTHIGVAEAPDAAANLALVVPMVNALNPDAVIISGDIGENSSDRQQARTILQGLTAPVYYLPGNHDISNDTTSLQAWRNQFGPDYYSFQVKNVEVLMLDSELLGNYDDFSSGIVQPLSTGMAAESQTMLNWLGQQGGTTNVLIAAQHIPLYLDNGFPSSNPYWTVNPPYDQSESNLLASLGIKHLLAGHWHNGRVFTKNGLTIHVAPATSWLPNGGQLGFAMHTITADGNLSTTFVPLISSAESDSSDFDLVWHLNQGGFPFADSTLQNPGLPGAGTASTSGVAGPGVAFDGATYLSAGAINLSNSFTISAWINVSPTANNIQTVWASKPGSGTANGFAMNVDNFNTTDGALRFITGNGASTAATTSPAGSVTFGQWHLVTAAVDTGANTAHIYVDGNEVTQGANSILANFSKTNTVLLGKASDNSFFFHGAMDEARIQAGAQSSAWIWASWATVATNSGFAVYGSVGNPAGPQASITLPANNTSIEPGSDLLIAVDTSDLGATITNVEFFANSADLGSATGAPFSFTWTSVPAGTYALTVVASDNAGLSITSDVVNVTVVHAAPLTVALTSPADGASFSAPAELALAASAAGGRGATTNVAFYLGSASLANVTNAPFTAKTANIFAGSYALRAVATDSSGASSTSSVVHVTITNSPALTVLQSIKTFFIIALENHDFVQANPTASPEQLLGNPACPYFNSLITPGNANAAQVSYATHYYNVAVGAHPSEVNYIWSEAGTDFGVHTDSDPSAGTHNLFSSVMHLSSQLTAAGVPWRSYQEDVQYSSASTISASGSGVAVNPYNGTTLYSYAVKHNPMAFFTDTQNRNCYPLTNFWTDLTNSNIGRYNWLTPDLYNEMHNAMPGGFTYHGTTWTGDQSAIAAGDNFLSIAIPRIMASQAYKDHGAIIIWCDETESTDDTTTTIPFVIISSMAKGNAYASTLPYSHASDLKTMDEVFGLAYQTNQIPAGETDAQNNGYNYVDGRSATVYDLSDLFQVGPAVTGSFGSLTLNASNNCSAAMIDVTGSNYIQVSDVLTNPLTITQTPAIGTLLAAGSSNQIVITVTDGTGSSAYSTNWVFVADTQPPQILGQPRSLTNNAGTSANFNVDAAACTAMTYQWYLEGNALAGETNSTLNIASVGPANVGSYSVVVSSAGGSTNSDPATLTVIYQAPRINGGQMMLGPGGFQLTFSGPSGQTYQVLASDDPGLPRAQWEVIGSGTFGAGNVIFSDPDAGSHPHRFYMITSP
ncbi:MAG TPA: Ig-like domain-containing protein [Candidatus Angelobacter sp.]|nr:Ig-like domain-containing protein [Candidatus Angelobacter sp.]